MKNQKAHFKKFQNKQLWQELKDIQQDWDSIKRAKPRSRFRKFSTGDSFSEYSITTSLLDRILENSPRGLMSSLQENRRKSPIFDEGLIWKVRNNDIAVQEILRERRAALANGKLKGRRLFEGSSEDGGEICSECFECLFQESEVRSLGSYNSDVDDGDEKKLLGEHCSYGGNDQWDSCLGSSCLSEEKTGEDLILMEGVKGKIKNVKEKRKVQISANLGRNNNGGRWMLAMAWLAVVTMALTFGLIVMSCNGGNLEEEKAFLIPT